MSAAELFVRVRYRRAGAVRADRAGRVQSGRAWARRAVCYFETRPDEAGERGQRLGYDAEHKHLRDPEMAMARRIEAAPDGAYLYTLILNPGDGHAAMCPEHRRTWVRETMAGLRAQQAQKGHRLEDWLAVDHTDVGNHAHTHVLAVLSHTLQKSDLAELRHAARSSYERHRDLPRPLETELRRDPLEGVRLSPRRDKDHPLEPLGTPPGLEAEGGLRVGVSPELHGKRLKIVLELGPGTAHAAGRPGAAPHPTPPAPPGPGERRARSLEPDL